MAEFHKNVDWGIPRVENWWKSEKTSKSGPSNLQLKLLDRVLSSILDWNRRSTVRIWVSRNFLNFTTQWLNLARACTKLIQDLINKQKFEKFWNRDYSCGQSCWTGYVHWSWTGTGDQLLENQCRGILPIFPMRWQNLTGPYIELSNGWQTGIIEKTPKKMGPYFMLLKLPDKV